MSILPLLKGGAAPDRDFFYWELHEAGPSLQAVRFGHWKGVKIGTSGAVELFDLNAVAGDTTDVAAKYPELAAKAAKLMTDARKDDPGWSLRDRAVKKN